MAAYSLVFYRDGSADPVQVEKPGTIYHDATGAFDMASQHFLRFVLGYETLPEDDRLVSIEVHRDGAMIYELKNHS